MSIYELCQLKLKLSNAQIICPKSHKLRVVRLPKSDEIVLYCKKCKQYYPFPEVKNVK